MLLLILVILLVFLMIEVQIRGKHYLVTTAIIITTAIIVVINIIINIILTILTITIPFHLISPLIIIPLLITIIPLAYTIIPLSISIQPVTFPLSPSIPITIIPASSSQLPPDIPQLPEHLHDPPFILLVVPLVLLERSPHPAITLVIKRQTLRVEQWADGQVLELVLLVGGGCGVVVRGRGLLLEGLGGSGALVLYTLLMPMFTLLILIAIIHPLKIIPICPALGLNAHQPHQLGHFPVVLLNPAQTLHDPIQLQQLLLTEPVGKLSLDLQVQLVDVVVAG